MKRKNNQKRKDIKLIIVDFYGVVMRGSYKDTCRWLASKYKMDYDKLYRIVYHKYFISAIKGRVSEKESFQLAIKELGIKENWRELRKKHLSFEKINKLVFNFCRDLQKKGHTILLLSQSTPPQLASKLKEFKIRKYFKNIINTYDYKLPKADKRVIRKALKKFRVKPEETIMIDDQDFNLVEAEKLGVKIIHCQNFGKFKKDMKKILK